MSAPVPVGPFWGCVAVVAILELHRAFARSMEPHRGDP
jgi:hypothetical protein